MTETTNRYGFRPPEVTLARRVAIAIENDEDSEPISDGAFGEVTRVLREWMNDRQRVANVAPGYAEGFADGYERAANERPDHNGLTLTIRYDGEKVVNANTDDDHYFAREHGEGLLDWLYTYMPSLKPSETAEPKPARGEIIGTRFSTGRDCDPADDKFHVLLDGSPVRVVKGVRRGAQGAGMTSGDTVWISRNAANDGWYVVHARREPNKTGKPSFEFTEQTIRLSQDGLITTNEARARLGYPPYQDCGEPQVNV